MILLLATVAGALGGWGVRAVLGRLRRGVLVAPGWCEGAAALLGVAVALAVRAGATSPVAAPVLAVLGLLAVAGTATDVLAGRLPDALTLPAVPLLLAALVPLGAVAVARGLVGGVALGAAYAAVHLLASRALGAGDVKLAAAVGVPLGGVSWVALGVVPVLAAAGLLVLAVALSRRRLPYGPLLLAAAWGSLLAAA